MNTSSRRESYRRRQSSELLSSVSIEQPLCNYLSVFDGTKKTFQDIRPQFDKLFSYKLIHLMDGHPVDKSTFICFTKQLLEQNAVATLEDIFFVDDNHVEYTVHWCGEKTSMVTHVEALVEDGRIIKITPCVETRDVFAAAYADCQSMMSRSHRSSNRLNQLSMKVNEWKKSMLQY